MTRTLGWMLGIDHLESIDSLGLTLAAPWAQDAPFWVFASIVTLVAIALVFYQRWQSQGSKPMRVLLGGMRGLLLAILVVTLADPILQLNIVHRQQPLVYVVVDGSESMEIEDDLPASQRTAIDLSTGSDGQKIGRKSSRMQYVHSLLTNGKNGLLSRLKSESGVDVETFLFDGNTTSQLHRVRAFSSSSPAPQGQSADALRATGQVTALGTVLNEIDQQFRSRRLAGVVLISDFGQNSGPAPVGNGQSPASRLGVPVYTVGIGATEAIDLAVDLEAESKMKRGEQSTVTARVRHSGLDGQSAALRIVAKELGGSAEASQEVLIGERAIGLSSGAQPSEFSFTPEQAGRFEIVATVASAQGEVSQQNNQATRQVTIIDDYLRLMYVAYEPTWEWRFVKEVFHRDKLVGLEGFRTFLSSSDPRVRESNSLFLPTLTPKRSEFFATDVLFIDDMPRSALSDRFCELTHEYVSQLGGGLVVVAGPRFGPREMQQTPLAEMLPVVIDPNAEPRFAPEYPEFRPRLTPHAARYAFMKLGTEGEENNRAWNNLGKLPWYQPVARPHPQAEVLLEHPTDKCADGKTPQPLIAIRPYGKGGAGEVVWIGFNEMWRLRRQYGEKYYRQFWSQLIYRLGMSHALGSDKRFVVRLDQEQYRTEEKALLSVEAYDQNYEPLNDENLPQRGIVAELTTPTPTGPQVQKLSVPMLRKGLFETRIPLYTVGNYSLSVTDPITEQTHIRRFEVTSLSAERREPTRNLKLQEELARATGGRSYDLTNVSRLPRELNLKTVSERQTRHAALWTTPAWFIAVVLLMLGEWTIRKLVHLP